MNREEFVAQVAKIAKNVKEPTAEEYKLIEYVYTWYPTVSETTGKAQVAWLYVNLGMPIFRDMEKKAKQAEELDSELRMARTRMERAQEMIDKLKKGEKELWEI